MLQETRIKLLAWSCGHATRGSRKEETLDRLLLRLFFALVRVASSYSFRLGPTDPKVSLLYLISFAILRATKKLDTYYSHQQRLDQISKNGNGFHGIMGFGGWWMQYLHVFVW